MPSLVIAALLACSIGESDPEQDFARADIVLEARALVSINTGYAGLPWRLNLIHAHRSFKGSSGVLFPLVTPECGGFISDEWQALFLTDSEENGIRLYSAHPLERVRKHPAQSVTSWAQWALAVTALGLIATSSRSFRRRLRGLLRRAEEPSTPAPLPEPASPHDPSDRSSEPSPSNAQAPGSEQAASR